MKKLSEIFNFTNYSSSVALISQNIEINYNQIDAVASEVKQIINHRCLVFLVCTNTVDSIIAYISIIKSGAVCLLVPDTDISNIVEKYKPKYIFCPKNKEEVEGSLISTFNKYSLIRTNYDAKYEIDDELAILLTTSGSTGSPKFVRISYSNLIENTNAITEYLNIDETHRTITTMPMSYTYGLSLINTHLNKGASIVVTESSLLNREFWELLKGKSVTNFGGVPYTYEILKKLRFERMNLPSLKYLTQAGGKLKQDLVLEFHKNCSEKGVDFIVMYGQTEATSRMSYLPTKNLPQKAGSIGIAIPNGKFHIVDDASIKIDNCFQNGELVFEGKNVSMGYASDFNDLKQPDNNDGILYTGDLAYVDEDGFYFIVGRKKRFSKIYGNRVNLDELENMVKDYGYECACVGEDDKITLYVVNEIDKEELLSRIMKDTELNKNAFSILKIKEIPRSESGKTLYYKLEK